MNAPHVPGCTGKIKYSSRSMAESRVDRARRKKWMANGSKAVAMHVYECPACHCWHLSALAPADAARSIARSEAHRANNAAIVSELRRRPS